MSTLERAEEAVERLTPEEFEQFLRWLSRLAGAKLESVRVAARPTAQQLAELCEERVQAGEAMPFAGIDLSTWPPAARERAQAMINAWRDRHVE